MRILIIGGTRFVGYHITRRLLDEGHSISVFNRGKTPDDFGPKLERFRGDRRDQKGFYQFFYKRYFDAVIDVIGYKKEDIETAINTFSGNVGHYLFISTGQVYLVTENRRTPYREEDFDYPLIPCPAGSEEAWFYGVEKRQCESKLMSAHQQKGFPVTILRLPIVNGERDYTLRLYSYLLRIADGGPIILPDGGETIIRHLYVGDLAGLISQIIGQAETRGQVYNLAQKEVLSLSDFLRLCGQLMKREPRFVPVSSIELLNNGLDPNCSPFSGQWVSYLDITKAEEELNFRSTPLHQWLKKTIDWFLNKYQGEKPANYQLRDREIDFTRRFLKEMV